MFGENDIFEFIIKTKKTDIHPSLVEQVNFCSDKYCNFTPLQLSFFLGKTKLAHSLLKYGSTNSIMNNTNIGNTLHIIFGSPCGYDFDYKLETIVKTFIKLGGDINSLDIFGITPLHYAFKTSYRASLFLLQSGANPDISSCNYSSLVTCITNGDIFENESMININTNEIYLPDYTNYGIFHNMFFPFIEYKNLNIYILRNFKFGNTGNLTYIINNQTYSVVGCALYNIGPYQYDIIDELFKAGFFPINQEIEDVITNLDGVFSKSVINLFKFRFYQN